jgi:hypothetical protein
MKVNIIFRNRPQPKMNPKQGQGRRTLNPSNDGIISSSRFRGSTMNRPLLVKRPSLVEPLPL